MTAPHYADDRVTLHHGELSSRIETARAHLDAVVDLISPEPIAAHVRAALAALDGPAPQESA